MCVGRYELRRSIGRGGNGVVYAAHDPRLQREVALKVLHRNGTEEAARSDARLIEARALGQLRHHNVVTVFDSGIAELGGSSTGVAFVVMELIDGVPLPEWLAKEPPLRRVVSVLLRCTDGLAAAHRNGVIHCDIKPSNILVGARDGVKVIDFGIAWELSDPAVRDGGAPGGGEGTRRYMAPEQHAGGRITEAVDQYGLAVTFLEALQPLMTEESDDPEIASEIADVLERAKRPDPRERFADMKELRRELARTARALRPVRRWWGIGVAAATVAAVGLLSSSEPTCASVHGDVAAALQRLRAQDVVPLAVGDRLAAQAYALETGFAEACGASGAHRQAMLACLDVAQGELRSAAELLERADLADESVAQLLHSLRDVASCDEAVEDLEAERVAFERSLASVAVAVSAGETRDISGPLTELLETAIEHDWRDAADRIRILRGQASYEGGEFDIAQREFETAYFSGLRRGDSLVAARAGRGLVEVETARGDLQAARRWGDHTESQLESAGVGQIQQRVELQQARGVVHLFLGEFEDARRLLEASVDGLGSGDGFRSPAAVASMHLALAELELGEHDRAIKRLEMLVDQRTAALGPTHPDVAMTLQNLASAYTLADRWDDAVATIRDAETIVVENNGDDDIGRSVLHVMLADAETSRGDPQAGLDLIQPARVRLKRDLPPGHLVLGIADLVLARSLSGLGKHAPALEHAESARALYESAFGAQHPRMGEAFFILAEIYVDAGRPEDAQATASQALALFEATRPPEHPWIAETRQLLARLDLNTP